MIRVIKKPGCLDHKTCGECEYYAEPLKEFLIGEVYQFPASAMEQLEPQILALIGSCRKNCYQYAPLDSAVITNDKSTIFHEEFESSGNNKINLP